MKGRKEVKEIGDMRHEREVGSREQLGVERHMRTSGKIRTAEAQRGTDGVRQRGQALDGGYQVGFQGLFQNCESRQ